MSISRRIARPLLASMFIAGGLDAIQSPESKVKAAAAVTEPLKTRFPALPEDTATLVRLNGMVQVGAGGLLATREVPPPGLVGAGGVGHPDDVRRPPVLGGGRR